MRHTYRLMHALGVTPWARDEIPAPLRRIVDGPDALAPAMALDLGSGTGEHARYLAGLGWSVTAVDFVAAAVARARRGDRAARVSWRVADVTRPDDVDPQGTLIERVGLVLDVGCLHGLDVPGRIGWAATVARVAAPEATVLVRAAMPANRGIGPRGIAPPDLVELLPGWRLVDQDGDWRHFRRSPAQAGEHT